MPNLPTSLYADQELAALAVLLLVNSPDGANSFKDFGTQLDYYLALAKKLPQQLPESIFLDGMTAMKKFNDAQPDVVKKGQTAIGDMLTAFATGGFGWSVCSFIQQAHIEKILGRSFPLTSQRKPKSGAKTQSKTKPARKTYKKK